MKKNFINFMKRSNQFILFAIAIGVGAWLQHEITVNSYITAIVIIGFIAFGFSYVYNKIEQIGTKTVDKIETEIDEIDVQE